MVADVCSSTIPGLMGALCGSRTVTLKQLVEAAMLPLADAPTLNTGTMITEAGEEEEESLCERRLLLQEEDEARPHRRLP